MNLNISEIAAQGESQTIVFLTQEVSPKILAKVIVALANADGGRVLIGVVESTNCPGIKEEQAIDLIKQSRKLLSDTDIFKFENIRFRHILNICVLDVKKSESIVLCEDGAYIRLGLSIKAMNQFEIQAKLSKDSFSIEDISEVLEKQTKQIDSLTAEIAESNTPLSKMKSHLIGGVVGLVLGAMGSVFGL
ncbi:helix-turn-helix domain-containing protein [Shewanella sp. YLB-07]|uniref:AlbA family DNA-binding domain-containing protein n=1 Tax=Shewanella sp. YLB-07 TaxID=2601268 RepID=UPI00128BF3B5|nr:RNA-binding domain-containing protein [Shewanella sp. YLB-07]